MERKSGVLMHVSSLWGDYSEGSLGAEAREWIDFLADCGFGVWQVLPFCLTDDCNSPYKSNGAFSVNPNFIDLPTLHRLGLLTNEELQNARQKTPYVCEFDRLREERFALLRRAASRLKDWRPVEGFLRSHPQTEAFCRFMALKEANGGKEWNEWTVTEPDEDTLKTWQFTQYEFCCEWAELKAYANSRGVKIIGDIPIYVAYDSADVWANQGLFQLDEKNLPTGVAGVPPDYFCEDGQLWGNPLYDWDAMKKDGYAWWQERIRFMLELFDGVRIDHFRGLESYFSVPAGETTARNGSWIPGPGMDLIRAIEPYCKNKLMIAEDLGVITKEVQALVEESGFPGMRVLQFGFLGDENSPHLPHHYKNHCVAYTGTHDNNTLLGYVWELGEEQRRRMLEYFGFYGADWNRSYETILRAMFASHAGLLILPVQDLLLYGEDTRINRPGNSRGNWSYRIKREQLWEIRRDTFRGWNRLYGRL